MNNKLIYTTVALLIIVLGVYIGASYLPQNKMYTPTPTPSVTDMPTASAMPTVTATATPTVTPTPSAVSKSITLKDNVSGSSFAYAFSIPKTATSTTTAISFTVKFQGGGTFSAAQVPEGYDGAFASFKQLSGKLGTYYRIIEKGTSSSNSKYATSITKTGKCQTMDGDVTAPCGIPEIMISKLNFLAILSCQGNATQTMMCDDVMKTMSITKK